MYIIIRTSIRIADGKFLYHDNFIECSCKDRVDAERNFKMYVYSFLAAETDSKKIAETRSAATFKREWTETEPNGKVHLFEDITKFKLHELL